MLQIGATEKMRSSTGLELQVMMPVVNAPFRFYWAYNPHRVREVLQPPIVADRGTVSELDDVRQRRHPVRHGVAVC